MKLIHGDCTSVIPTLGQFDCIFADPPDNIGLDYNEYDDHYAEGDYIVLLEDWLKACMAHAPIVWFSFNAKWTVEFGTVVYHELTYNPGNWLCKPCVQVFTFGQHNQHWLGNNHRPLWCIYKADAKFFPDAIRIPSWRQLNGDKRASSKGRVPGDVFDMQYPQPLETWPGDVFDFPRVTGNSKQRQSWHPTQLHEDLVERVVKFSTPEGGKVLDPFAGTGTTLRVCKKLGRDCTTIEMDNSYCERIARDHSLVKTDDNSWSLAA